MYGSLNADFLRPQVLTKVVSQIAASHNSVVDYFGFGPGGVNVRHSGEGRNGMFYIYNHSRDVVAGSTPGTAAGRGAPQNMKGVPFVFPRAHEVVALPAEDLHNLGRIDDPARRDEAGREMILRQAKTLGEKNANWRAVMTTGMMRGSLYTLQDGDKWYFSYTKPNSLWTEIPYGMPAGNKGKLDMLGDGDIIDKSWSDPTANIPEQLGRVNAARQELYGGRLDDIFLGFAAWNKVMTNEYVAKGAGAANTPFTRFERLTGIGPDGRKKNLHVAELITIPGVTFHITDEGLNIGKNGKTFEKTIPDNHAILLESPSAGHYEMREGSEPIAEFEGAPIAVKVGMASWSATGANPTRTELFELDNALPINYLPGSIANATVIF